MSAPEPGVFMTMIRSGLVGYCWATTLVTNVNIAAEYNAADLNFITSPPIITSVFFSLPCMNFRQGKATINQGAHCNVPYELPMRHA
jgi:hypothetical protein